MSVTTDVTKTGDTVTGRFTIKNLPTLQDVRKPAYAYAGLADLVLEQVKKAPGAYVAEVKKAQDRLSEVPSVVTTLPTHVRELREEVEARLTKASEQAGETYSSLAERGQRLVTAIRRQPSTQTAVEHAQAAVEDVEEAATEATKSAKSGAKAAKSAAKKLG